MATGIYQLRNKKNNKIYIGSSVDTDARMYQHFNELSKGTHINPHLQSAYDLDRDYFIYELLLLCERHELLRCEQGLLDKLNPEYNIATTAGAPWLNKPRSEETRGKMSESKTGTNNNFYGKKHTEETKDKMRLAKLGKSMNAGEQHGQSKLTKETVIKMRQLYASGDYSYQEIADLFEISQSHVSNIINRKYWRSV